MRAAAAFVLLLLCGLAHAQKNDFAVFAVGNFEPTTRVYINLDQQMIASNRSAAGGGVEYRHWFTPHYGFGAEFEQNPSNGKLVFQPVPPIGESIWPEMHYEVLALYTERAPLTGALSLMTQEGAGVNLTNGYSNSGWSHDVAFAQGAGVDYQLSKHTALEVKALWLETETGCYNGRACKQTFGLVTDAKVGWEFSW